MNIKDSVAIVTGGASGLGEGTVRSLVASGARAAILDVQEDKGASLAKELGRQVMFVKADITNGESTQNAINNIIDVFGSISIVVNCAGVADPGKLLGKDGPLSLAHFNKVIQINLAGTINVSRLAAEQMIKNIPNEDGEKGVIINTASAAAFDGQIGQIAYSASKAGVVGMTLPMARECAAYGIRVMTIAPGIFMTPMIALMPEQVQKSLGEMVPFPQRLGKPSEYALLVKQIIENPMLNGEVIRLDGAIRMAAK
ncbi:MAG: 3-hydroxyacyl-CoA dehydrogenase [Deltaproteobacteria bacterium HGW-Deltaproteobacteria-12]|jgi:NAD(P)-dependent dehydrogenase (short-subunit alcohol dehydrogenase family)|nr:MAG: 3-hydroxyacyl-CoA dehydrogenase [Deltaproteobacteria bacterium HGW-Deltaproteobacteria-12]